jgi:hypothetical protein
MTVLWPGGSVALVQPRVCAAVVIAAVALLLTPVGASAASPVLEFVVPGKSLPVSFTTSGGAVNAEMANFGTLVHCTASHGDGEITGTRSAVSSYVFTGCETQSGSLAGAKCQSNGASSGEITTGSIDAELVYISQARHEVGMLLNPGGGTYIVFECGGESAEGRGPFLSPIAPINKEATSFTATLSSSAFTQTPDEYENGNGEKLKAIPEGQRGSNGWVTTGVQTTITVLSSASGEVKAITAEEVEEGKRQEAIATAAAEKRHEEENAAANKRELEEATKRLEQAALATLRTAIERILAPNGKATGIGALLRHDGLTLSFSSSEPGTLVIQWWQVPSGAHLAKKVRPRPTLVAEGRATFAAAGTRKVKISLTRGGRRLLARASKLRLTSRVRFTATAHPTISEIGALKLRR